MMASGTAPEAGSIKDDVGSANNLTGPNGIHMLLINTFQQCYTANKEGNHGYIGAITNSCNGLMVVSTASSFLLSSVTTPIFSKLNTRMLLFYSF